MLHHDYLIVVKWKDGSIFAVHLVISLKILPFGSDEM